MKHHFLYYFTPRCDVSVLFNRRNIISVICVCSLVPENIDVSFYDPPLNCVHKGIKK